MGGQNNQPIAGISGQGDIEEETQPEQNAWGGVVSLFQAAN
jgi:hypothetical protein